MRLRSPDWGARKLQVLLKRDGLALTRSTIHHILLRHDLVREQDRNSPATERFERSAPNELWQMDFKGPSRWPQPVGPLSVLDDHSNRRSCLWVERSIPKQMAYERPGNCPKHRSRHSIPLQLKSFPKGFLPCAFPFLCRLPLLP